MRVTSCSVCVSWLFSLNDTLTDADRAQLKEADEG